MHLLVGTQERFSRGATIDADEWWQGPAEIHDDPPVRQLALGVGGEWVGLTPGDEWGSRKGAQHGSLSQLSGYVGLDISRMVDC